MIVRPVKPSDIPAIVEIVERCGLGVDGLNYSEWTGVVLVCVRQEQVIGFMAALPGHPYAVITEYGVLPEHQKSRAAFKLWESMELLLRSLGCKAWGTIVSEKRGMSDIMQRIGAVSTGETISYMRML